MPHFDADGNGTWICQVCARIFPDTVPANWLPIARRKDKSCGNVCPNCTKMGKNFDNTDSEAPISLHEHCRRESGLEGQALRNYINRHYGHD